VEASYHFGGATTKSVGEKRTETVVPKRGMGFRGDGKRGKNTESSKWGCEDYERQGRE